MYILVENQWGDTHNMQWNQTCKISQAENRDIEMCPNCLVLARVCHSGRDKIMGFTFKYTLRKVNFKNMKQVTSI